MKKLTNKEIVQLCEDMRKKHSETDWGFRAKQTANKVKIYWGYLDYMSDDKYTHFTIEENKELGILIVRDEQGYIINDYLENDTDIEGAIQSVVYYMVSRY